MGKVGWKGMNLEGGRDFSPALALGEPIEPLQALAAVMVLRWTCDSLSDLSGFASWVIPEVMLCLLCCEVVMSTTASAGLTLWFQGLISREKGRQRKWGQRHDDFVNLWAKCCLQLYVLGL